MLTYAGSSWAWLRYWDAATTRTRESTPAEIVFIAGVWVAPFAGLTLILFHALKERRGKMRPGFPLD
jgi:hypothetical protein